VTTKREEVTVSGN